MRTKLLLLLALACSVATQALAQAPYPSKPIQMLVGFPAGGGNDILARLLAAKLQEAWGQPVVVVNKPGASSIIAMEATAKAPPDGYTLLLNASVMPVLAATTKMSVDILRDLEPVSQLTTQSFVLVVNPSLPVHSVKEFIAFAKNNPRKLNYGSPAATFRLVMELFKHQFGIEANHVPYKGSAQTIAGLLANDVQVAFVDAPALAPQIRAGKLRGLAVTTRVRSSTIPEIPTMIEAGVPDFEVVGWFALFAPAGTPKAIVNKLHEESAKIVRMPEMREKLAEIDCIPVGGTPAELHATMEKQTRQWIATARLANINFQ